MLAVTLGVSAQGSYCKSYDDYVAGRWIQVNDLEPVHKTTSQKVWLGGNDYKFKTGDKAMDKVMKKEAFIIRYQDTLYVNLRTLRYEKTFFGNGYAKGLPFSGKKVMFVTHRIGKSAMNKRIMSGVMFGAIGSAVSANSTMKDRVCYLIDNNGNGKTTDIKLIGDEMMEQLLSGNKKLLSTYKEPQKQKERESAENVLPLLKKMKLIK